MKRLLTLVGTKIIRFFWSWDFLKFCLWTITLIILFYVEEDWRGARAWAATKAEWEAKGETFDFNKYIPPPVPDDENLAAIPLFKLVQSAPGNLDFQPSTLRRAMRDDLSGNELPPRGNWMRGEMPDMAKIRDVIATDYTAAFEGMTLPQDTIDQFDVLYPLLSDLRAASATRPFCRFNVDYTILPPFSRSLGSIVAPIQLSQILTLHAILALDHHQSDLALEDIKINYKLLTGAARDPTLVGGLVAIGVNAITQGAIFDGLARHAWSDAQLVELDQILKRINFLSDYQFAFRSEAAESVLNLDAVEHTPRFQVLKLVNGMSDNATSFELWDHAPFLWPTGWWENNKCLMADFGFHEMVTVDANSRRVFPNVDSDLKKYVEKECARWDAKAPWHFWFSESAPSLDSVTQKYAYGQVWIDEARIACALERYRLARGVYPGSLEALAPAYIDELPHDIMNGQPYHYQLRADGTFLLYSVGWNQTDDGGKVIYMKNSPTRIDYDQGDWVWPTPRSSP